MPRKGRISPQYNQMKYESRTKSELSEHLIELNEYTVDKTDKWIQILNQKRAASRWLQLSSSRRGTKSSKTKQVKSAQAKTTPQQYFENLNSTLSGICSEGSSEDENENEIPQKSRRGASVRNIVRSSNRTLLIYFAKLARSGNENDELDLDFIESLVNNGADINMVDKYGQSVFHEVARTWHPDVGVFLLALNANINQKDKFGRTPLHVAAAVNYPEMVKFLIENGADQEARTYGEDQTPVHYAAKNDAVDSLRMLIKLECDIEVRDCKQRTPLQVAAELDRSETALYLVEEGADVGVRASSGLTALTLMIQKMPPVANKALDHFHRTDRPNRKQYFYLHLLEPSLPGQLDAIAKTPMQAIIQNRQMNLLLHPVLRRLTKIMWREFAMIRHIRCVIIQVLFVLVWSVFGLTTPYNSVAEYTGKSAKDIWWRIVLECIASLATLISIVQELYEWRSSINYHLKWQTARKSEVEKDLIYCHPRWPEEKKYILQELDQIRETRISYFSDLWNVTDWVTYVCLVAGMIARSLALSGNEEASGYHRRILSFSMIIVWVRLLKYIRAFTTIGPFVVMLGHILIDTMKFIVLMLDFFIPNVLAFWIMFGGSERAAMVASKGGSANGWSNFNDAIYSVFLVLVVGDFNYDGIQLIDKRMAQILITLCISICGILLLNLFIALMSDTFQRVYDNANANALMEKAVAINLIQMGLGRKSKDKFRLLIHGKCAPEEVYYDDDDTEDSGELEKMTIQIKEVVDEIQEKLDNNFNSSNGTCDTVQNTLVKINEKIDRAIVKQRDEIIQLNHKIDMLSSMVQSLMKINQSQTEAGNSSQSEEKVKLTKLPEIYELKPDIFGNKTSDPDP